MIFYRSQYTNLWITLTSNETLGILDSDYLQDYYGTDGYITLKHLASNQRFAVPMSEVVSATPGILHDVFRGAYLLSALPNGDYIIEGRVRDVLGNYSIFNAVQTPNGDEQILPLTLSIVPGNGVSYGCLHTRLQGGLVIGAVALHRQLRGAFTHHALQSSFNSRCL